MVSLHHELGQVELHAKMNANLLTAEPVSQDLFRQSIAETGPRSWAEKDIRGLMTSGQVSLDESKGDKKGPISIATAVSATSGGNLAWRATAGERISRGLPGAVTSRAASMRASSE